MRLDTPIRDVAAFTLCAHSRAEGMQLLDATIKEAARRAQRLNALFAFVTIGCGVVLGLSVLALVLIGLTAGDADTPSRYALATALGSAVALLAAWFLWTRIQYGRTFRFARLPDGLIGAPLQKLIAEFASQARDARTSAGAVRAGLFLSGWAILLFSDEPNQRGWVRSPSGLRETREIFTSTDSPSRHATADARLDDNHGEPALMNHNPEDQWLVGGSAAAFNEGLDRFLYAEIVPDQTDWFRLVLSVGRRELRRGGQRGAQAATIKRIKSELERHRGNSRGPHGGESAHLIKQLLQGRRGKTDIKRYFADRDV